MPLDGQVLPDLPDDLLHHHHHHHHLVGEATQDQEGSEEELESSQTPKKRKLDSIRAGLPAHGLRITQSQVMRMLKMIQEDPSMRKDFYLVTDHPLYELIVKKPTANKCMEMMSAIAAKDKGSPDPTIKIDLNFELGETMNRTGTQWGGCYIKLTPSKHSMSRKSRLRERVIPYPAYPGDPAVYTGPFTTSPGPVGHAGVVVGGMPGVAPPSPPGLPLPPFATAGAGGDPRGMGLRVAAKRGEEEDEQQQQQQQQMVQEARADANGQDENGSFQSAMSWLYGTWDRRDRLLQERAAIIHQLQREREEMRLGLEERDTILRQRDEEVNRMREEINLLLREMQKLKEGGTEESSTEELFLLEKILESSRNVVRERIKRSAELKEEKKVDEAVAGVEPPAPMAV
jgi:hypothetical protein